MGDTLTVELDQFYEDRIGTVIGDGPSVEEIFQMASQQIVKRDDPSKYRKYLAWKPEGVVRDTLEATTRFSKYHVRLPMRRHFKSRYPALNVKRLGEVYATDTFYANVAAHNGATCAQLFVGRETAFTQCYGMKSDGEFPSTLMDFIRAYGAMKGLFSDNAKALTSHAVKDIMRQYCIMDYQSEPMTQWQNRAERRIQYVKRMTTTLMDRTGTPGNLWLLAMEYACHVLNHLAHDGLKKRTPIEVAFGYTPDISHLLIHVWYDEVLYYTHEASFPESREKMGRFVGIENNVGDVLTFKVRAEDTGQILERSVVRPVTEEDPNKRAQVEKVTGERPLEILSTDKEHLPSVDPADLVGSSFLREREIDGLVYRAHMIEEISTDDGSPNQYLVVFGDGDREEVMTYGQVLDHLEKQHAPVDPDDQYWMFDEVKDHKRVEGKWHILVIWQDGSSTWEPLRKMMQDDPVTVEKYAFDHDLLLVPGWKSLRRYAKNRKKINRLLKQIRVHARKYPHMPLYKFGIKIPRMYKEALEFDATNENNLWQQAMETELQQLKAYNTFEDRGKNTSPPLDYQLIHLHPIFDCKHDYRRKARMVAGGHRTEVPKDTTYSSVVSLRGLRTVLFIGELNGMKMKVGDIGNAYLEAFTTEKVCFYAGFEFESIGLGGHLLIITKVLYGLKSSGARFHDLLADVMHDLGFFPSHADPDIWMRDKKVHWEYIATWVDDLMYVGHDPDEFYAQLTDVGFKLKGVG